MKKLIIFIFLISTLVFIAGSCNSDDGSDMGAISDAPLAGMINGLEFSVLGGKAFDFDDNEISINIADIDAGCDSFVLDYDLQISVYIPKEEGTYQDLKVVFQADGLDPINNFSSTVVITTVSDTQISGKLRSKWDMDNYVEGSFTISYCGVIR